MSPVPGPPQKRIKLRHGKIEVPLFYQSKDGIKAVKDGKLVESTNTLQPAIFFTQYMPAPSWYQLIKDRLPDKIPPEVIHNDAKTLRGSLLDQCFTLIEETSANDYRNSEKKWSPSRKRKEMMLPDLRYIVLARKDGSLVGKVEGFVSFMVTYEDGHEVIYCYEIHLSKPWQGKGIGSILMGVVEDIGRKVGVEKAMLTVFKSNERARKMYEKLGYVEDDYSPEPRKLRNGTIKEHSYQILSKRLKIDG